ncbi:MAG: hypothetical protein HY553_22115 [Elusimicrobia bacterium]|nr:hypothetical protein [Elusimicrobiota bacterium]
MDKPQATKHELQPFVQELVELFAQGPNWPSAAERVAALQRVGIRINRSHGYEGMVFVCDAVRDAGNRVGAAELEGLWDGIGEWRR